MPTNVIRKVELTSPCTFGDVREFVNRGESIGVEDFQVLDVRVVKGYADCRGESSPDYCVITAVPFE
jgi:hypothetical protein